MGSGLCSVKISFFTTHPLSYQIASTDALRCPRLKVVWKACSLDYASSCHTFQCDNRHHDEQPATRCDMARDGGRLRQCRAVALRHLRAPQSLFPGLLRCIASLPAVQVDIHIIIYPQHGHAALWLCCRIDLLGRHI